MIYLTNMKAFKIIINNNNNLRKIKIMKIVIIDIFQMKYMKIQ